jgi:hypothetical protein
MLLNVEITESILANVYNSDLFLLSKRREELSFAKIFIIIF